MFCYRCGGSMPDTATACPQCGATAQQAPQPTSLPPTSPAPPAVYQPGVSPGQPPQSYSQPQESSGQATASLILGILSVTCLWIFAGIPAVVLGHLAKSNIRKSGGRVAGDGKATAGLIMGYISIGLIPLILIIAAIAIPSLLRAKIGANEAAAASAVRIVNTAQVEYLTNYNAGYARDLATLGSGPSGSCAGTGTQEYACLISGDLGNSTCTAGNWCVKNGYEFSMTAVCGAQGCTDYVMAARSLNPGSSGTKSYCSTNDAVVRFRDLRVEEMPTVEECQSWSAIL